MTFIKRIFLFLLVNLFVILTASLLLYLFNVSPYLTRYGLDYKSLMIFCLIWGMAGALISLSLSRIMAKWLMRIKIISKNTTDPDEMLLYKMVEKLSKDAGLPTTPEVGLFISPEVNAFATGPTKRKSLVAVSTGLLQRMEHSQIEAIIGHEITHIANGDMVTMTLLQGVINAFVMFLARVFAYALSTMGKNKNSSPSYFSYIMFTFIFEIIFMLLGSMIIAGYSRFREYRADEGGARLSSKQKMISALSSLKNLKHIQDAKLQNSACQAFKISNSKKMLNLFATHPPLEKRIERLKEMI